MNATAEQHYWTNYITLFSEQNKLRPTRIGSFSVSPSEMDDLWLEDGLRLTGIGIDTHDPKAPEIEIMLDRGGRPGTEHLTHVVRGAQSLKMELSFTGEADCLEVKGADGRTTVLRFERS